MDLDIGCTFVFDVGAPVHAVMMFEPHWTEVDNIGDAELRLAGGVASTTYLDVYGNVCRRMNLPTGRVEIAYTARAHVPAVADPIVEGARLHTPAELPDEVLGFLLPSRYCESDQLADQAWSDFGAIAEGWQRVQAISDWVHTHLRFDYGSSSPSHSAVSVLADGVGVCRDFTHAAIALCRAVNVPARYVFGYLPDIDVPDPGVPMDFCAWMEVYLGDRWHTFDPRNNQRRIGRVVVGRGRDAADVALVTSFGRLDLIEMSVRAEPGEGNSWSTELPRAQLSLALPGA